MRGYAGFLREARFVEEGVGGSGQDGVSDAERAVA